MSHGLSRQPCGSGLAFLALLALAFAAPAWCGSIFLTGHDPDFHASVGSDKTGANNLNRIAVDFVANPLFNPFRADDITTLLYVESSLDAIRRPQPHQRRSRGGAGRNLSGVILEKHDASSLDDALNRLGDDYAAIVIAS